MITPWEIYWVLQLDSFSSAFGLAALVTAIAFVVLFAVSVFWSLDSAANWCSEEFKLNAERHQAAAPNLRKIAMRLLMFAFLPIFIVAVALPSTKTAAAMIIVPEIVNSPTIQHEAGDLYKLAKEALSNAIAPAPKGK